MRMSWKKMHDNGFLYSEEILQWIWQEQLFENCTLKTTEGKSLRIINQGVINHTNGPDFSNAQILIDGIRWIGSIELHLESRGWNQHGHQDDEAYNQVVLHIVADHDPIEVFRKDGSRIPTLNILPYLPQKLNSFVSEINKPSTLPCTSGVTFISDEVYFQQIEKAHIEYLEKKGNDFLSFYNPDLIPSRAWKEAFILSIFDGFGIANNREPMVEVGKWFLNESESLVKDLVEGALDFAGFSTSSSKLVWNYKGVYPANHPKKRIPQAVRLAILILDTPFEKFLEGESFNLWEMWGEKAGISNSKLNMLFGIIHIPAIFMLGNLFGVKRITEKALKHWLKFDAKLPKYFSKQFSFLDANSSKNFKNKLGVVHQLRSYCKPRRCHECFVLKKAILS